MTKWIHLQIISQGNYSSSILQRQKEELTGDTSTLKQTKYENTQTAARNKKQEWNNLAIINSMLFGHFTFIRSWRCESLGVLDIPGLWLCTTSTLNAPVISVRDWLPFICSRCALESCAGWIFLSTPAPQVLNPPRTNLRNLARCIPQTSDPTPALFPSQTCTCHSVSENH